MYLGLDLEVVSRFDEGYSATRVAAKVARYSPCMIWSRGGVSGGRDGGGKGCMVSWVCGREFYGYVL